MTGRKTLHEQPWSWTLEETGEGLLLTVVCGTVGLYEMAVLLEPGEIAAWERDGPAGLEPLAEAIRHRAPTGTGFSHRWRPDLVTGADPQPPAAPA